MRAATALLGAGVLALGGAAVWHGTRPARADDVPRGTPETPDATLAEPELAATASSTTSPFDGVVLAWPFHDHTESFVYQTYGQAQGSATDGNVVVHGGVDLACAPDTPVFAPIAGTIVSLFSQSENPRDHGLVLESHGEPPIYVQLLHVDGATMPHELGRKVALGEFLGDVAPYGEPEFHTHLHLALIAPPYLVVEGSGGGSAPVHRYLEVKNPILLLEGVDDGTEPEIVEVGQYGVFRLYGVAQLPSGTYVRRTGKQLDPAKLDGTEPMVNVEVGLADAMAGNLLNRVTPLEVLLRVHRASDDAVVLERGLLFDGPLNQDADPNRGLYVDGTRAPGQDATYVLHMLTMCPLVGGAPDRALCQPEQSPPLVVADEVGTWGKGDYVVRVRVADHEGHVDEREMTITLGAP